MNMNSSMSPSWVRIVKTEPGVLDPSRQLVEQREQYEQEISRLQKTHDEQVFKLCHELEKSSGSVHQLKMELDMMRISLSQKEKQLKSKPLVDELQNKNSELITENIRLRKELAGLTMNYQTLFKEMEDARQYLLTMIDRLK